MMIPNYMPLQPPFGRTLRAPIISFTVATNPLKSACSGLPFMIPAVPTLNRFNWLAYNGKLNIWYDSQLHKVHIIIVNWSLFRDMIKMNHLPDCINLFVDFQERLGHPVHRWNLFEALAAYVQDLCNNFPFSWKSQFYHQILCILALRILPQCQSLQVRLLLQRVMLPAKSQLH